MKLPTLIGLTGFAGTGKDTVRAMLQDAGYTGFALADPIRSMLRDLLLKSGISDQYIESRDLKEITIPSLGVSYRHMAQSLGTEWGRSMDSDFWLRIAGSYLHKQQDAGGTHFCVSDIRFANEAQWVRERGGVIWRIDRPDAAAVRFHASEYAQLSIQPDLIIPNHGTVGDLHRVVVDALDGVTA
jgi:hypothetical protein